MNDLHTIHGLIRMAQSKLASAERFFRVVPSEHKSSTEIFIQQGSEELFNASIEALAANTKFYNLCKEKADQDFFKDFKL